MIVDGARKRNVEQSRWAAATTSHDDCAVVP
jgi:hypothetical protein